MTAKPDTLCHGCIEDIQKMLGQLPALRDAVKLFIGFAPKSAGVSKVKASRDPAAPMNIRAFDLVNEIDEVLDRAGGPGVQVRDLVQRPAEKFDIGYLDGVQRALDVRRVWSNGDSLIGLSQRWERRQAPCPRCGGYTLGTFVGSGTINCSNADCGSSFPLSEYEAFCIVKAKEK